MSGTLQTLGVHVPQPEVRADNTNPKGFGEPEWVVRLHDSLLRRANVQVSDARPQAWFETGKLATDEAVREQVHGWLDAQFAEHGDEVVIKDPRLSWFLGLWRSAAVRSGAEPAYVTMLRPVTEVVGSKQQYYTKGPGELNRTAAWVNVMLHTERASRGSTRAFVRYDDLLDDWTVPLFELGEIFDLRAIKSATANQIRLVHNFIDPSLRRVQLTWDDLKVPTRLRELADETWQHLDKLAAPDGDVAATHEALDQVRAAYADFYADCEAISESSAVAARRAATNRAARPAPHEQPPAPPPDRLTRILPHDVRAKIPPGARRAVRRALRR